MTIQAIHSESAPNAIGPYSQAIKAGASVFLSGQIPIDVRTGALVEGDFETKARQVLDNLSAVAQAAGGGLKDAVKLTVYLTDFNEFPVLNTVMQEYFDAPYPARATVQVSFLPLGSPIEIDAILVLSNS